MVIDWSVKQAKPRTTSVCSTVRCFDIRLGHLDRTFAHTVTTYCTVQYYEVSSTSSFYPIRCQRGAWQNENVPCQTLSFDIQTTFHSPPSKLYTNFRVLEFIQPQPWMFNTFAHQRPREWTARNFPFVPRRAIIVANHSWRGSMSTSLHTSRPKPWWSLSEKYNWHANGVVHKLTSLE